MILELYTHKFGKQQVLIDDEDYKKLRYYNWTLWSSSRHNGIYVIGYAYNNSKKSIRLHRLILGAKPGQIVDHINGNPLDNRRCNIRLVTSTQNNQNATKRKDGLTSKFKGVSWCSRSKKWKAQIQVNKKKLSLGSHDLESNAALAYNYAIDQFSLLSPKNKINE